MKSIPRKALKNRTGRILRRVQAGESFTVTVEGKPVAHLSPATPAEEPTPTGAAASTAAETTTSAGRHL